MSLKTAGIVLLAIMMYLYIYETKCIVVCFKTLILNEIQFQFQP